MILWREKIMYMTYNQVTAMMKKLKKEEGGMFPEFNHHYMELLKQGSPSAAGLENNTLAQKIKWYAHIIAFYTHKYNGGEIHRNIKLGKLKKEFYSIIDLCTETITLRECMEIFEGLTYDEIHRIATKKLKYTIMRDGKYRVLKIELLNYLTKNKKIFLYKRVKKAVKK
jgi:hypothetical protein